jgi:polyhydroxyalkanoate synthesis regulator phasin
MKCLTALAMTDTAQDMVKEMVKNLVKDLVKNLVKDMAKKIVKDMVKEIVKKGRATKTQTTETSPRV